jgi:hypothetical protein
LVIFKENFKKYLFFAQKVGQTIKKLSKKSKNETKQK